MSGAREVRVALVTASEEIKALFVSQMSERAQKMLLEDMETQVPPRRKTIDAAQSEIIDLAKRLIGESRVVLMEQGENQRRNCQQRRAQRQIP